MTRIAIAFFGITRSLALTLPSIEANVLAPARAAGDVKVFAHFFRQDRIVNPRSLEDGEVDPEEHRLLAPDWLALEAPDLCLEQGRFDELKAWGDAWNDEFRSLRNLVHQLHSLDVVSRAVLADGYEHCLFVRPDLTYHDSLARPLAQALAARRPTALVPWWQPFGGLNDRFALCAGAAAIAAYGQRGRLAPEYCAMAGGPLLSERLVAFALAHAGIAVRTIGVRATRTRLGGHVIDESFAYPWRYELKRRNPRLTALLRRFGVLGAPGH